MRIKFASANLTVGQLNDIVNKLGGHDMALRFLRDELSVSESTSLWREENGVIYFSVTSDGTTSEDWIRRLEDKGFYFEHYAEEMLRSTEFKPTTGVRTEVAVLKGMLFEKDDRIMKHVYVEAYKRKLSKPNIELACLIREKFTGEDIEAMGLNWIIVMHEPINDSNQDSHLLCMSYNDRLNSHLYRREDTFGRGDGFALVVSQVGPQK